MQALSIVRVGVDVVFPCTVLVVAVVKRSRADAECLTTEAERGAVAARRVPLSSLL